MNTKTLRFTMRALVLILVMVLSFESMAQDTKYTLEECIDIAMDKNLTIQRSQLDLEVSRINKGQAKLERLPDLNLGSNYTTNWGRTIDPTTNQFITRQNNSANINGRSNLTLYSGLQIHNTVKQTEINYQAGSFDLEKSKNDIVLNVATLYLNVIFNKELLETANYQYHSTTQQLERTKKLVDAGSLPITNLLNLQSQAASQEVTVINAENNYNLAILNLKQSLLIPANDPFEVVIPEITVNEAELVSKNPTVIFETAELIMPEVKSADLRKVEADLNYKISKGAYAPTLSFSAGLNSNFSSAVQDNGTPIYDGTVTPTQIGYLGTNNSPVFRNVDNISGFNPGLGVTDQFRENISKNVGFNLSIPIFNKFRTRSNVQKSILTQQRAQISSQEVRNQLRQSIESAYNDMAAASKSYTANQKQVDALKEVFRIVENQFNLGAAHFVDYQVASNNLYVAESDLLRSKYDFVFKQKILDFYLGKSISF